MKHKIVILLLVAMLLVMVCAACNSEEAVVICGNCATKVSESSKYCPSCGVQLFAGSNTPTATSTQDTTERTAGVEATTEANLPATTVPPTTEPPTTQPPATTAPPATQPPATQPPATTAPPATDPPATTPPTTESTAHTHNYTTKAITNPTCTEKGYTTYTCACGELYITDEVAAKGHSHTKMTTAPTCTEKGYTTYTCPCGDTYTADEVAAKGHSWSNWETTIPAEVGKIGQEKRTCSACTETETREIPALQEDFTKTWFVAQYNIAKQQYILSLEQGKVSKQDEIAELKADIDYETEKYNKRRSEILKNYPPSETRNIMLTNLQENYAATIKPYKEKISRLETEIATIDSEIANPSVDNILAIVARNCNISSLEVYEYYSKYSNDLD